MRFDRHQPLHAGSACPFCVRESFSHVLAETPQLYLVADNAPLVEGHLLIIPRTHYTCMGATPPSLDSELAPLLAEASAFCASAYRPAILFEHGIFAQSVPHAHLHVVPVGALGPDLLGRHGAQSADTLDAVRAFHAGERHYVYLGQLSGEGSLTASLFPPDMSTYMSVLNTLRSRSQHVNPDFAPQHIRRLGSAPMMDAVAARWAMWQAESR